VPEDSFQNSLAVGGRLFVVVGREPAMRALLITRSSESQWASECLFETVLPPLAGVQEPERFVL
jgi:protein-L-isoaspartate(D-aspartate) O-methyltransferase